MEKVIRWIDANCLLKNWQVSPNEMADWVCNSGLPAYDISLQLNMPIGKAKHQWEEYRVHSPYTLLLSLVRNNRIVFKLEDVVSFRKDHPEIQPQETASSKGDFPFPTNDLGKTPDYDDWAQMDYWTLSEAVQVLCGRNPSPFIDDPDFIAERLVLKDDPVFLEISRIHHLGIRAIEAGKLRKSTGHIYPVSFVKWAMTKKIPVPDRLVEGVRMYHKNEFEEKIIPKADVANEDPITGQEHRELGRLRQQKDKWERAIKAAVHATLFSIDRKVTREELSNELYKFELPDTTLEIIWKGLREERMTKGPGRPKKTQ